MAQGNDIGQSLAALSERLNLSGTFKQEVTPSTPAQILGLGPAAYERLIQAEREWQAAGAAGKDRSIISPVEMQMEENAKKKEAFIAAGIPMDDAKFADHQRRKSDWEARVESGKVIGFNDKDPDLAIQITTGKFIKSDAGTPGQPSDKLNKIIDDQLSGTKPPDRQFTIG